MFKKRWRNITLIQITIQLLTDIKKAVANAVVVMKMGNLYEKYPTQFSLREIQVKDN